MNKKVALEAFHEYSALYDTDDIKIRLKIDHTYRVAEISTRIAESAGADADFSWFLGLLHDIGRFEQLTQYGTFKDADSVDHAELGADILFKGLNGAKPLIGSFIDDDRAMKDTDWEEMAGVCETAIRLHNKLTLPQGLDEKAILYCKILRDADKCDIFRVLTEPPYDERNERIVTDSAAVDGSTEVAGEDVMNFVYEHRCVPRKSDFTLFEALISQCCMGFELESPESVRIVREQGYLNRLMNMPVRDPAMAEQLATLRFEMMKAWEKKERKPD